jgi:flavin reductase (DIM6/NTAB) family NADH-FMN oxidoreductase RutF
MPFLIRAGGALPVPIDQFRSAMRRWGSGVSILTTRREGGILGITVSSFCSLSLNPPLVLACIDRKARSHASIEKDAAFAVNVLKDSQERLSELAAGHLGERGNWLEDVPHRKAETGAPVLADCLAWFDCRLEAVHDGGDHTIFVGRVEAAGHSQGRPLLYYDGAYHRLSQQRPPRRS